MASKLHRARQQLLLLLLIIILAQLCCSIDPQKPHIAGAAAAAAAARVGALVAPVAYDAGTQLFSVAPLAGGPFARPLLLSLDNSIPWLNCVEPAYLKARPASWPKSALRAVRYGSAVCNAARVENSLISGAGFQNVCFDEEESMICRNGSCGAWISGSYSSSPNSVLWTDTIAGVAATDGRNPTGAAVAVPGFTFGCAGDVLTAPDSSVPTAARGAVALSRARLALPSQLAARLGLSRRFAYCLPREADGVNARGVLFFGKSPYAFSPGAVDFSSALLYTPLLTNPREADSYFIGVRSISVDATKLAIPESRLKLRNDPTSRIGNEIMVVSGTIVSSTVRYTTLNSSMFDLLLQEFKAGAKNRGFKEVPAVAPFEACYDAASVPVDPRVGFAVPFITFTLLGGGGQGDVKWTFYGANSAVSVDSGKAICLAFLRANPFEPRAIILGTFQQGDALLQFDLATSRLGFVPTLLASRITSCSKFNFTATS